MLVWLLMTSLCAPVIFDPRESNAPANSTSATDTKVQPKEDKTGDKTRTEKNAPINKAFTKNYEIQEFCVWFGEPTVGTLNTSDDYLAMLPSFAQGNRPSEASAKRKIAPLALMTFFGEPVKELDVEIHLKSARALGHWPTGTVKSKRLVWTGIDLRPTPSEEGRLAFTTDSHWFQKARDIDQSLYLSLGTRLERLLAYDLEVNMSAPLKVEGGPDKFKIINQSPYTLHDVLLVAPAKEGRRLLWIDQLPSSSDPKAAPPTAKPSSADAELARMQQEARGKISPARLARLEEQMARLRAQASARAPAVANKPASKADTAKAPEHTLGQVLKVGSPEWEAQTTSALRTRLAKSGLRPGLIQLAIDQYRSVFFESDEMVVLFRLGIDAMDQIQPLELFPEPTKRVRSTLVLLRRIDPTLSTAVDTLITRLGDDSYHVRDEAEQKLIKVGAPAFPALKKALKNTDLEVVFRAERILLFHKQNIDGN